MTLNVARNSLLTFMVITHEHSSGHASLFTEKAKSQFSPLFDYQRDTAVLILEDPSKREAVKWFKALKG